MLDGILQVLTNPTAFFRRLNEDKALASQAIWLVLIVSALGAVAAYLSTVPSMEAFGDDYPFARIGLIITPISAFIVGIILWLIYGLLIRIGAGMEAKPWAIASYSLAPSVIITTLILLLAALFPAELTPVSYDLADPDSLQAASLQVQEEYQASLFGQASLILQWVASLWMLLLIFIGVNVAAGQNKAVLSTVLIAIPTLGFLLLPFLT